MSDNIQSPEHVVSAFIQAMHEWEVGAYKRYKQEIFEEADHAKILAASAKAGDERKQVVARYCSTTQRYPAPFGYPPQYDPARERIVEVRKKTAKRVEVLTEYMYPEQYINEKRRYKLILTGQGWKIDDRTTQHNKRWFSSI